MKYRQIAKLANVSISTVSKVMSGSSEISRETAELVLRIAKENNIEPPRYNRLHSSLRIAIIVPEIISISYSQMVSSIAEELRNNDIEPFIHTCGFARERYFDLVKRLSDNHLADGIISFSDYVYPHKLNCPLVIANECNLYDVFDNIYCDVQSGIFDALAYLVSLGHTDIGFIGEKNTSLKHKGFFLAAEKLGIPINEERIFISRKRFEQIGYDAAEHFIRSASLPTALIAAYDEIALGAMHIFDKNGIKVPDDISIIGINDIPASSYADIPLTSLRTYVAEISEIAVEKLLKRINSKEEIPVERIPVSCELVHRNSTAAPRKK